MTEWFKYPISKDTLPKDQAYPIRPNEIGDLIEQNQLRQVISVALLPKTRSEDFIKADYQGENTKNTPLSNEFHPYNGKIRIWIYGVNKKEKIKTEAVVRDKVIPMLIEWIKDLDQRNENWKQSDHNIKFKYDGAEVKVSLDDNNYWG